MVSSVAMRALCVAIREAPTGQLGRGANGGPRIRPPIEPSYGPRPPTVDHPKFSCRRRAARRRAQHRELAPVAATHFALRSGHLGDALARTDCVATSARGHPKQARPSRSLRLGLASSLVLSARLPSTATRRGGTERFTRLLRRSFGIDGLVLLDGFPRARRWSIVTGAPLLGLVLLLEFHSNVQCVRVGRRSVGGLARGSTFRRRTHFGLFGGFCWRRIPRTSKAKDTDHAQG